MLNWVTFKLTIHIFVCCFTNWAIVRGNSELSTVNYLLSYLFTPNPEGVLAVNNATD